MFKLTIQNHKGEQLQLTQNANYAVVDVDGLNPPQAQINLGENAVFDGATYNSAKMTTRELVITVLPRGDIEGNRIALYQYFKVKKACTVYIENGTRSVYIEGYVKSMDIDLFSQKEKVQISIICPDPYFRDTVSGEAVFSTVLPLFEFVMDIEEEGIEFSRVTGDAETSISNVGDAATGMIIEFYALSGAASNPTIYNADTSASMTVNIDMIEGDIVRIVTNKGKKGVYLIRSGVTSNILSALDLTASTVWLELESGTNTLIFDAETGKENLECIVRYDTLYEGV